MFFGFDFAISSLAKGDKKKKQEPEIKKSLQNYNFFSTGTNIIPTPSMLMSLI